MEGSLFNIWSAAKLIIAVKLEIWIGRCQCVQIEPSVSLMIGGKKITSRQLEALVAVYEEGSQNRAARRLGIATPVLHRYLTQLEEKAGAPLTITSKRGTKLTREGRAVVREFMALKGRARSGESVRVGCSIITEDLLLNVLSKIDAMGPYDLIISDDERNIKDFRAGLMDVVILDDPIYAFEFEDAKWEEVAEDYLLHIKRGEKYMRFRYGAQRIGFLHLESVGKEYEILGTVRSLPMLLRPKVSFFLNQSYAAKKGLELKTFTHPQLLMHKIIAMYSDESREVERLINEMRRKRL
jgi:molybdenum-dependent DNA-binding transcriptional regulator ModE